MTPPAQPDPYRTQIDILVDWKREFIKLHGYYPNINDVWNKIDDLRGAEKSIRAGEISNICKLCRLRDECITEHDTRSRPHPAPALESEEVPETCPSYSMCREIAARKAREDVLDAIIKWKRKNCFWVMVDTLTGQKRYHFDPALFDEFIESLRSTQQQAGDGDE